MLTCRRKFFAAISQRDCIFASWPEESNDKIALPVLYEVLLLQRWDHRRGQQMKQVWTQFKRGHASLARAHHSINAVKRQVSCLDNTHRALAEFFDQANEEIRAMDVTLKDLEKAMTASASRSAGSDRKTR